jgi:hypothetical protein
MEESKKMTSNKSVTRNGTQFLPELDNSFQSSNPTRRYSQNSEPSSSSSAPQTLLNNAETTPIQHKSSPTDERTAFKTLRSTDDRAIPLSPTRRNSTDQTLALLMQQVQALVTFQQQQQQQQQPAPTNVLTGRRHNSIDTPEFPTTRPIRPENQKPIVPKNLTTLSKKDSLKSLSHKRKLIEVYTEEILPQQLLKEILKLSEPKLQSHLIESIIEDPDKQIFDSEDIWDAIEDYLEEDLSQLAQIAATPMNLKNESLENFLFTLQLAYNKFPMLDTPRTTQILEDLISDIPQLIRLADGGQTTLELIESCLAKIKRNRRSGLKIISWPNPKATTSSNANPTTNYNTNSTTKTTTQNRPLCPFCKLPGHLEEKCWKKNPSLRKDFRKINNIMEENWRELQNCEEFLDAEFEEVEDGIEYDTVEDQVNNLIITRKQPSGYAVATVRNQPPQPRRTFNNPLLSDMDPIITIDTSQPNSPLRTPPPLLQQEQQQQQQLEQELQQQQEQEDQNQRATPLLRNTTTTDPSSSSSSSSSSTNSRSTHPSRDTTPVTTIPTEFRNIPAQRKLPYIKVDLRNHPVDLTEFVTARFLMDTGSSVDILNEETANLLTNVPTRQLASPLTLQAVEHPVVITRSLTTLIRISELQGTTTFLITRASCNILGYPTITRFKYNLCKSLPINHVTFSIHPEINQLLQKLTPTIPMRIAAIPQILSTGELLTNSQPPVCHNRHINEERMHYLREFITEGLKLEIIEEGNDSTWLSPMNLVKKGETFRPTLDCTNLNRITLKVPNTIPAIPDILYSISRLTNKVVVDLSNGYFHVEIPPSERNRFGFATTLGKYQFKRLVQGHRNSPSLFHNIIMKYITTHLNKEANNTNSDYEVFSFIDDIAIASDTLTCQQLLKILLTRLAELNFTINAKKLQSGTSINFLGSMIKEGGLSITDIHKEAIAALKSPTSPSEAKSKFAFINFHRNFVDHFSTRTAKLRKLVIDPSANLKEVEIEFNHIKELLKESLPLRVCPMNTPIKIYFDFSMNGLGACLSFFENNSEVISQFTSRATTSSERSYTPIEGESLAAGWACLFFRFQIMASTSTKLITDHKPLVGLFRNYDINSAYTPRLSRLIERLRTFDITLEYLPGSHNVLADALSRNPIPTIGSEI